MASTMNLLNELLAMHSFSLPSYLASAKPWIRRGDTKSGDLLRLIAADQRRMADRIGAVIVESGGTVQPGEFPMLFTDMHDLSTDYLLNQVMEFQRHDVARIGEIVAQLERSPAAVAIAKEALGAAKAHLDQLEELMLETPA